MRFISPMLAGSFAILGSASGVIIDDFRAGEAWLQADMVFPGSTGVQSSLNPAHVLGTSRNVYVGSGSGFTILEIDPAEGILTLSNSPLGYFELGYGLSSDLNVNLLARGDTAFRVTFLNSMHDGYAIQIESRLPNSSTYASSFIQFSSPLGGGESFIPFSKFAGVDLNSIDRITISGSRIGATNPMRMSLIETVPEPSVGLVSLLGSVALSRRKRPSSPSKGGVQGRGGGITPTMAPGIGRA